MTTSYSNLNTPHARGQQVQDQCETASRRKTPACTGTTSLANRSVSKTYAEREGIPPRIRGSSCHPAWFTPVCGISPRIRVPPSTTMRCDQALGIPPRIRGSLPRLKAPLPILGYTPAHTGFPGDVGPPHAGCRLYPRAYGVPSSGSVWQGLDQDFWRELGQAGSGGIDLPV